MNALIRNAIFGLLLLPAAQAWAEPVGYSVNSDEPDGDALYRIDLATGQETLIGTVQSLGVTRKDIEGLAFDSSGTLWATDEESLKLFPIDTATGLADHTREVSLAGLDAVQGNDFGLTFTCEDELYASSVTSEKLYRLAEDGTATEVGDLGVRISALAAWGNPVRLFGLGNGKLSADGPNDNRSLYEIDIDTGTLTPVGKVGNQVSDYFEAGLSFDEDGNLWAITDRSTLDPPAGSEVHALNIINGKAALQSTTTVTGFESLAVAGPSGCDGDPPILVGEPAFPLFEGIPTLSDLGKLMAILMFAAFAWVRLKP